jgi:hypothetical protein
MRGSPAVGDPALVVSARRLRAARGVVVARDVALLAGPARPGLALVAVAAFLGARQPLPPREPRVPGTGFMIVNSLGQMPPKTVHDHGIPSRARQAGRARGCGEPGWPDRIPHRRWLAATRPGGRRQRGRHRRRQGGQHDRKHPSRRSSITGLRSSHSGTTATLATFHPAPPWRRALPGRRFTIARPMTTPMLRRCGRTS